MTDEELIGLAIQARKYSYAPYSHYTVGAALLARSGKVYTGCNVENASYGLAVCAERVALWKAISEGERDFLAIAIVTENGGTPCGACRQVLAEFVHGSFRILVADALGNYFTYSLDQLLPKAFTAANLLDCS